MPLWPDLLRTPLLPPETVRLRRLRRIWQLLCMLTALWIGFITPLRALLGPSAPRIAALLIVATLLHGWIYWAARARAARLRGEGEEQA